MPTIWYNRCPICGTLHDDGAWLDHNGKRRYICLDCADKLPIDKGQRQKWLNRKLKD